MRSGLKIKNEYLAQGITNSFLAEKAGIKLTDLYMIQENNPFVQRRVMEKILKEINNKKRA